MGNVGEYTAEWYAGLGSAPEGQFPNVSSTWVLAAYNGDGLWNIASSASDDGYHARHPAVANRGGELVHGQLAGVFALELSSSPASWGSTIGFRCAVR